MQHWELLPSILHPAQGYYCSTVHSIVSTLDVLVTCMPPGTTVPNLSYPYPYVDLRTIITSLALCISLKKGRVHPKTYIAS